MEIPAMLIKKSIQNKQRQRKNFKCSNAPVLKFVNISLLKTHEHIRKNYLKKLSGEIKKNGFVKPIIVDINSLVILDGHHRFYAIKNLGYKNIPVYLVDYKNRAIKVLPRRKEYKVSKKIVIKRGMNGNPFPPKTTKHVIKNLTLEKLPLICLKKESEKLM